MSSKFWIPCLRCHGSGEVDAGITFGENYGPNFEAVDWCGNRFIQRARRATHCIKNPRAIVTVHTGNKESDYQDVYLIEKKAVIPCWDQAVCGECHGTGIRWG